ncbi:hypothetical protein [Kitasatospora purpeofusca]|uniref:hypothetical protein n=1 Tax=Kitasatospora purpeofusca TaxID=67352 RepID=UPI002A5996BE|nr:hypothetical protein [Kitasatospora purpeofusca]MDY0811823.1 hypothetical protein [Kitasatospora purpeofusca]
MSSAETATPAAPDARAERRAKRIAKNLTAFAAAHGGSADGVVEYVGSVATRIVVVGADGAWGDQVAPSYAVGRRAAELAGVTLHESFEGELGLKVRTGPYEWKRMAGIQIGG